MKKLIQLLVFAALITTLALPVLAQTTPSTSTTAASGGQDDAEAKAALYKTFTDNIKKDPAAKPEVAYQAGKDYLAKYEAKDGPDDQYVKYIKNWVTKYEKIARRQELLQQITDKKYNEAFASSRQVLADFPDDLAILFELARAGTIAMTNGNQANNADTINYTKRTIQLIESGKSFDPNKPFTDKDKSEMLGKLNNALGLILKTSSPTESLTYFVKAAQMEGSTKTDPLTYNSLAELYESNEYTKLATQFTNNCKTEEQAKTQECVDLKNKTDQVVDHIIDALARAIAYSNISPDAAKFAQARTAWMDALTKYYKYRNNDSDTGLKELIAGITSRPLPKPGEAVTPPLIPQTAPTSTSTAPTQPGGAATATPASKTTTSTAATTPAATKQGTTTQPTGKTSSTKTTPRRSH